MYGLQFMAIRLKHRGRYAYSLAAEIHAPKAARLPRVRTFLRVIPMCGSLRLEDSGAKLSPAARSHVAVGVTRTVRRHSIEVV
jgi:hypothetical protein